MRQSISELWLKLVAMATRPSTRAGRRGKELAGGVIVRLTPEVIAETPDSSDSRYPDRMWLVLLEASHSSLQEGGDGLVLKV